MDENERIENRLLSCTNVIENNAIINDLKGNIDEKIVYLENELRQANKAKIQAAEYGIELLECNKSLENTIKNLTNENTLYKNDIDHLRQELYILKQKLLYNCYKEYEEFDGCEEDRQNTNIFHDRNNKTNKSSLWMNMECNYTHIEDEYKMKILEYESHLKKAQLQIEELQCLFDEKCQDYDNLDSKYSLLENNLGKYYDSLVEIENLKKLNMSLSQENTILDGKITILLEESEYLRKEMNEYKYVHDETKLNKSYQKLIEIKDENNSFVNDSIQFDSALHPDDSYHKWNDNIFKHNHANSTLLIGEKIDEFTSISNNDSGIQNNNLNENDVKNQFINVKILNQLEELSVQINCLSTQALSQKVLYNQIQQNDKELSLCKIKLLNYDSFINNLFDHIKCICGLLGIKLVQLDDTSCVEKINSNDNTTNSSQRMYIILDATARIRNCVEQEKQLRTDVKPLDELTSGTQTISDGNSVLTNDTTSVNIVDELPKITTPTINTLLKSMNYELEILKKELKTLKHELTLCRSQKNHLQQKYNHLISRKDGLNVEVLCKNELLKFELQLIKNKFSSLYQKYKYETNKYKKEIYEINLQLQESIHQKLIVQNILEDVKLSKDIQTIKLADYKSYYQKANHNNSNLPPTYNKSTR